MGARLGRDEEGNNVALIDPAAPLPLRAWHTFRRIGCEARSLHWENDCAVRQNKSKLGARIADDSRCRRIHGSKN